MKQRKWLARVCGVKEKALKREQSTKTFLHQSHYKSDYIGTRSKEIEGWGVNKLSELQRLSAKKICKLNYDLISVS